MLSSFSHSLSIQLISFCQALTNKRIENSLKAPCIILRSCAPVRFMQTIFADSSSFLMAAFRQKTWANLTPGFFIFSARFFFKLFGTKMKKQTRTHEVDSPGQSMLVFWLTLSSFYSCCWRSFVAKWRRRFLLFASFPCRIDKCWEFVPDNVIKQSILKEILVLHGSLDENCDFLLSIQFEVPIGYSRNI